MDDIVIWVTDLKPHLCTVKKALNIRKANNIMLNKEKMLNCCDRSNMLQLNKSSN